MSDKLPGNTFMGIEDILLSIASLNLEKEGLHPIRCTQEEYDAVMAKQDKEGVARIKDLIDYFYECHENARRARGMIE